VLDLLDESVQRGIVSTEQDALGRFRFGHALIREVLYDSLSATARIELHQRVGDGLEAAYADDPEPHLAELAHHFLQAAPAGDLDKAVGYAAKAGERAMSLLAFEEAARSYERALQALDLREAPDRALRCDLLLALGTARSSAGDPEGAKDAFNRASELARRLRDAEREGQAALGYAGRYWTTGVVDASAVSLLERAISALGENRGLLKAEMLGRLATQLYYSESHERLDALSGEAVQIARGVGDPGALASVLAARIAAVWGPENLDERTALADEIVDLAAAAGDREIEMRGRTYRVGCLLEKGEAEAADLEVEAASRIAEELRHPLLLWHTRGLRSVRALMSGRFEEAERLSVEALEAGRRADEQNALQYRGIHLTQLGYDQGRLEEVEQAMRAFVEQYKNLRAWRCTLALLLSELGRDTDARREFELAGAADWQDVRRDGTWLTGMARAVEACARLRDTVRGPRLYELMLPYAGRAIVLGRIVSNCIGAADRPLGMLAAAMGRAEESDSHFERAIELDRRMGAEPWVARAQLNWGEALIARGEAARAGELLDAAAATAERLGMPLLLEQIAVARAPA
jgi:tetratricopeptide (TPR) repeat protein